MEDESSSDSNGDIYVVEKILDTKFVDDKFRVYKVRWEGYGSEDDTWEPDENLITCNNLLKDFWERRKIAARLAKQDRRKKRTKQLPDFGSNTASCKLEQESSSSEISSQCDGDNEDDEELIGSLMSTTSSGKKKRLTNEKWLEIKNSFASSEVDKPADNANNHRLKSDKPKKNKKRTSSQNLAVPKPPLNSSHDMTNRIDVSFIKKEVHSSDETEEFCSFVPGNMQVVKAKGQDRDGTQTKDHELRSLACDAGKHNPNKQDTQGVDKKREIYDKKIPSFVKGEHIKTGAESEKEKQSSSNFVTRMRRLVSSSSSDGSESEEDETVKAVLDKWREKAGGRKSLSLKKKNQGEKKHNVSYEETTDKKVIRKVMENENKKLHGDEKIATACESTNVKMASTSLALASTSKEGKLTKPTLVLISNDDQKELRKDKNSAKKLQKLNTEDIAASNSRSESVEKPVDSSRSLISRSRASSLDSIMGIIQDDVRRNELTPEKGKVKLNRDPQKTMAGESPAKSRVDQSKATDGKPDNPFARVYEPRKLVSPGEKGDKKPNVTSGKKRPLINKADIDKKLANLRRFVGSEKIARIFSESRGSSDDDAAGKAGKGSVGKEGDKWKESVGEKDKRKETVEEIEKVKENKTEKDGKEKEIKTAEKKGTGMAKEVCKEMKMKGEVGKVEKKEGEMVENEKGVSKKMETENVMQKNEKELSQRNKCENIPPNVTAIDKKISEEDAQLKVSVQEEFLGGLEKQSKVDVVGSTASKDKEGMTTVMQNSVEQSETSVSSAIIGITEMPDKNDIDEARSTNASSAGMSQLDTAIDAFVNDAINVITNVQERQRNVKEAEKKVEITKNAAASKSKQSSASAFPENSIQLEFTKINSIKDEQSKSKRLVDSDEAENVLVKKSKLDAAPRTRKRRAISREALVTPSNDIVGDILGRNIEMTRSSKERAEEKHNISDNKTSDKEIEEQQRVDEVAVDLGFEFDVEDFDCEDDWLQLEDDSGYLGSISVLDVKPLEISQEDYLKAFCCGEYETILGGIANGMDPDCWDSTNGGTPLWFAIEDNRYDVAKKLLKLGSNPNFRAENGKTALMVAVEEGKFGFVSILLRAGAHVNLQLHNGETALILACRRGHEDIINLLLNYGADVKVTPVSVHKTVVEYSPEYQVVLIKRIIDRHTERLRLISECALRECLTPSHEIMQPPILPCRCISPDEKKFHDIYFKCQQNASEKCTMIFLMCLGAQFKPSGEIQLALNNYDNGIEAVMLNKEHQIPVFEDNHMMFFLFANVGQLNSLCLRTHKTGYKLLVSIYAVKCDVKWIDKELAEFK
eukprot:gene586-1247_t